MGISVSRPTTYNQIGLKPDNKEIRIPPITHLVATIEERVEGLRSPKLKTLYTRVSSPETDTRQEKSADSTYDTGSNLESAQPHTGVRRNIMQSDPDMAQARFAAADAPDSQ